jgi:hypothetical protein
VALNNYPHAWKVDYDGATRTVYYTEQARADKNNMRLYNNIDWLTLAKDKVALTYLSDEFKPERADLLRILTLIDAVQDDAQERGYSVVWHMPVDAWVEIERAQNNARAVVQKAAVELFDALKTVVDSSCGSCSLEWREVSATAIAAARELLKRLEADDGAAGE